MKGWGWIRLKCLQTDTGVSHRLGSVKQFHHSHSRMKTPQENILNGKIMCICHMHLLVLERMEHIYSKILCGPGNLGTKTCCLPGFFC